MEEEKPGISTQSLVSTYGEGSKLPQWIATLVVSIGSIIVGTLLGWTSTSGPLLLDGQYGFPVSEAELAWISSTLALGAMLAPIWGWAVGFLGRKYTLLLLSVPNLIGWALIIWADSVMMFCIGRVIGGLSAGGFCVVVPLYINELSEISIKGTLGTCFQLLLVTGLLYTYIIGSFVSVFMLSVICAILPVVFIVSMLFLPESPVYLLKKGQKDKAKSALQWFRGSHYDTENELMGLQRTIDEITANPMNIFEAFQSKAAKKGLLLGIGEMFFQQFSGVNSMIFYTTLIFENAGSSLDPHLETIIVGLVSFIFTLVSAIIVDKVGRRPLLFLSDLFMAISTGFLGLYFYLQSIDYDVSTITWLPILSISVFTMMFAIGYGPIPWVFIGEAFPPRISGYASSIITLFNWIGVFVVTKTFSTLKNAFGNHGAFWTFTVISAIGTMFVYFLVPETKGKSVEQIQQELEGIKSSKIHKDNSVNAC